MARETDQIRVKLNKLLWGSKAKAKKKNLDIDIDLEYLHTLYIGSGGICPMTGVKMQTSKGTRKERNSMAMSIDRIDSDVGYIKGNVRLVSTWYNNAKAHLTDEMTITMAKRLIDRSDQTDVA
tara:strand:- start:123 stop:491 length:369 start_codon:yes stop_codon:yes gene_type:complete